MVSQRKAWKKFMICKPYICPTCKRDKGMLYLFPDNTIRYVCFCGSNIEVDWIKDSYDFEKQKFVRDEEQVKKLGSLNKPLPTRSLLKSHREMDKLRQKLKKEGLLFKKKEVS